MDDLATLRKNIQEDMVQAVAMLLPRLVEKGMTSDDPDVIRKIVGTLISPAGLEPEKKQDMYANLPRANIVINLGAGTKHKQITVDVPEFEAVPTPAMLQAISVNEDVDFD